MTAESGQRRPRLFWGIGLMITGIVYAAVSIGLFRVDESTIHVPGTILFLVSVVLIIGGMMMVAGRDSRLNDILAGGLLLAMAAIGGWVAIFGSPDRISGGLAFLPPEMNVGLARVLFGLGSIVSGAMSLVALRRALRRRG